MSNNFTQLYIHCVWGTWDRRPLITPNLQNVIYASISQQCKKLDCQVIAIGGIEDHIHLLVDFPVTLTISKLIAEAKGSSSHFITHEIQPDQFFKWQGGYGVFTVSQRNLEQVINYIKNQPIHHRQKHLISDWEI